MTIYKHPGRRIILLYSCPPVSLLVLMMMRMAGGPCRLLPHQPHLSTASRAAPLPWTALFLLINAERSIQTRGVGVGPPVMVGQEGQRHHAPLQGREGSRHPVMVIMGAGEKLTTCHIAQSLLSAVLHAEGRGAR